MGKFVVDLSMSLDGFITGPNDSVDLPLGEGGERLHDWIFGGQDDRSGTSPRTSATDSNREVMDEAYETTGAVVMGRRWFDIGEHLGTEPIELERTRVIDSPDVTHLRFCVIK